MKILNLRKKKEEQKPSNRYWQIQKWSDEIENLLKSLKIEKKWDCAILTKIKGETEK